MFPGRPRQRAATHVRGSAVEGADLAAGRRVSVVLDAGRPEGRGVDVDVGLLGWIFWGAAVGGLVAVVVAFAVPRRRRSFLIGAAVLFLVAGVLGILSFGIVLIVLSAACAVGAWRTRSREESRVP